MKTYLLVILMLLIGQVCLADQNQEIADKIRIIASIGGIDPELAVAIAKVESGLNPNAVGGMGEIGLFQLRPEFHYVIPGNAEHNMIVGIAYLMELHQRFGKRYGKAWFVVYNYGPGNPPKHPKQTEYYKRVMKEYQRLSESKYAFN